MAPARAPTDAALVAAARRLGRRLVGRGWQLAAAESCTGGLVGHTITQVPRASDHFLGGVVSYSDAVKHELLGVADDLLARSGAVSAEVAEAMATGALERFKVADLAVAVTGIAGMLDEVGEVALDVLLGALLARGGPSGDRHPVGTEHHDARVLVGV